MLCISKLEASDVVAKMATRLEHDDFQQLQVCGIIGSGDENSSSDFWPPLGVTAGCFSILSVPLKGYSTTVPLRPCTFSNTLPWPTLPGDARHCRPHRAVRLPAPHALQHE